MKRPLPTREYAGHAMTYAALEEWADLGIGGAILPASHVRLGPSAPVLRDRNPVELTYEAVWRTDLLVAQHAKDFVRYLAAVVPRLVGGMPPDPDGRGDVRPG